MLNFYPWGLSINIARPVDHETTNVSFISYVYDETKIDSSAGALLDTVEMEDEEVVQGVQKGIQSRFYSTGRFSPSREQVSIISTDLLLKLSEKINLVLSYSI